jgi:DNA-binding transcriptional ArsR family regulator
MLSADNYLASLQQRFRPDHIDETIERLAYRYLQDPPAMQRLIVGHLQMMWDRYLDDEWQRIHPILESTARAYARLNLNGLTFQEAARSITGQDMQDMEKWDWCLAEAKRSIFIPHPHVGPYLFRSVRAGTLYVFFSPRRPEGSQDDAPDLSRAEIVVRLNALADDTRLHILKHIADHGELRSHEIMSMLDLSQSAASRHLSQLSAGGYLKERRCEGAKCYELNTERLNGTLQAVSSFLLGKRKG